MVVALAKPKRFEMPRVPSDEVVLAHPTDGSSTIRKIIMGAGFRFNQVLDCDKVHAALARLLEIGEWRKLGGRLRLNDKGRLEIHIPRKFTPQRPAVRYTHTNYPEVSIGKHPLGSRFPHPPPDGAPSILTGCDEFKGLLEPDETLHSFDDFLHTDHPQISLHCVTFRDATVITMKWPHSMTDGMGRHALFRNWSRVLAGREDLVQPLMGFDEDPVAKVAGLDATEKKQGSKVRIGGQKKLSGLKLVIFIVRFILAMTFGAKQVSRMIFLPAKSIQALRDQVQADLDQDANGSKRLTPSEGDILMAWLGRMSLSAHDPKSSQPVALMSPLDIRRRVPEVFGKQPNPEGPVWIQNLVIPATTHIPLNTLLTEPLGKIALRVRASILEQATPESIARYCNITYPVVQKGGMAPPFLKRDCILFVLSNWHCAKMFETIDFGPAVVKDCSQEHDTFAWSKEIKPGKPVTITPATFSNNPEFRNSWAVVGRDTGGNYWLHGVTSQKAWDNIEKELERLKTLKGSEKE
ncbi:hypothetical protein V8F20_005414 [Naviculisporaceae sp. PSN 640]